MSHLVKNAPSGLFLFESVSLCLEGEARGRSSLPLCVGGVVKGDKPHPHGREMWPRHPLRRCARARPASCGMDCNQGKILVSRSLRAMRLLPWLWGLKSWPYS